MKQNPRIVITNCSLLSYPPSQMHKRWHMHVNRKEIVNTSSNFRCKTPDYSPQPVIKHCRIVCTGTVIWGRLRRRNVVPPRRTWLLLRAWWRICSYARKRILSAWGRWLHNEEGPRLKAFPYTKPTCPTCPLFSISMLVRTNLRSLLISELETAFWPWCTNCSF